MYFLPLKAFLVAVYLIFCIKVVTQQSDIQTVLYKVYVVTSDQFRAGTDADVFLKIHGKLGSTKEIQLTKSGNLFERGSTDTFHVSAKYVGNPITEVEVKRNAEGLFDDWKLEQIDIKASAPMMFRFAFNEWIPANKWVRSYGGK